MNLIILAAGVGRRLYPMTKDKPKSLLDIGDGVTLLDKQLSMAAENPHIDQVFIVGGYKVEQIEDRMSQYESRLKCEVIYNPFFDTSNNLISLWCVQHLMLDTDFMITNGDNIYKNQVYNALIADRSDGIYVLSDQKDHYDEDDMKIQFDQGKVSFISKKIDVKEAEAESVGFVRISGEKYRRLFHDQLLALIRLDNAHDEFWLEIFNALCRAGERVDTLTIDEHDWGEMDFHPDVELMRNAIIKDLF